MNRYHLEKVAIHVGTCRNTYIGARQRPTDTKDVFTPRHLNPLVYTLFQNAPGLTHTAYVATHFPLQLKDFSLMLLTQVMCCKLKIDKLLRNLWVTQVRGAASGLMGSLLLPEPCSPTATCNRWSSLSSGAA